MGLVNRLGRLLRANKRLAVSLVCAAVFLFLLGEVFEGEIMRIDTLAYKLIVEKMRSDAVTPFMEGLSALATPVVLVVVVLVVAAFAPGRRPGWCLAVNLALVAALNVILKSIVQRPRPEGFRLAVENGFSFPSGHSMAAMAFYGLIAWFIWHYERDRVQRNLFTLVFALVIVMVGVSRIYLGVHYASDVIGGFCVSLIWLAFYTHFIAPLFLDESGGEAPAEDGPEQAV